MTEQDPTRLSEGTHAELRTLLSSARNDVPDEREMKAMGLTAAAIAGLATGTGVLASGTGAAGAAELGAAKLGAAKLGAGVGSAGAGAGTATGTGAGLLTAASLTKLGAVTLIMVGGAGVWIGRGGTEPPETPAVAPVAAPTATETASPPMEEAPEEAEPPAKPPAEPIDVEQESAIPTPAAPDKAAAPRSAQPPSEVTLLRQAQRALKSHPARALQLAKSHQRHYPQGQLSQEREVIRIEALHRLGQTSEAESRERSFDREYPESAHRSKISNGADEAPPKAKRPPSSSP